MYSAAIIRAPESGVTTRTSWSLAYALLTVLLFLFLFRPGDLVPVLSALRLPLVTGVLCLCAHVAGCLSRGQRVFAVTPITLSVAALSVWALAAVPFAFWQFGSLRTFLDDWIRGLMMYLLIANVPAAVPRINRIVWLCIFSVTAVSLMAVAGNLLYGKGAVAGRLLAGVSGPYSGSNYFSITVLLVLPFALVFLWLDRGRIRWLAGGACLVLLVANVMTASRAGALGMGLILAYFLARLRSWGRRIGGAIAALALGGMLTLALGGDGVLMRLSTLFNDYDVHTLDPTSPLRMAAGSQRERIWLMEKGVTLTFENPIFGVGMGNFGTASAHRWPSGSGRDWISSHNTYLQFSSELGIPGLFLYLALFYVTWRTVWRVRQRLAIHQECDTESDKLAMLCDATLISLLGYAFLSAFSSVAYHAYFFLLAGIAEAAALAAARLEATSAAPRRVYRVVTSPAPALSKLEGMTP